MKQLVRITGRTGVVSQEWMSQGQLTLFLRLAETRSSRGVAFNVHPSIFLFCVFPGASREEIQHHASCKVLQKKVNDAMLICETLSFQL